MAPALWGLFFGARAAADGEYFFGINGWSVSFLGLELQDGEGGLWREVHRDPLAVIYTVVE